MRKLALALAIFAGALILGESAQAASVNGMEAVVVCDPTVGDGTTNCLRPKADGSIDVNGAGGGSGGEVDITAVGGNAVTDEVPTHDADLLAAIASEVPAGDEEIGKTTPTISNLISGTITSAMTATTSTSLIAAPGSGLTNYITNFVCSNADADTDTVIALQDGNGGTTFYSAPAAKTMGGFTLSFPVPLKQPTANTALYVVNETTGATTKCSASGFKR